MNEAILSYLLTSPKESVTLRYIPLHSASRTARHGGLFIPPDIAKRKPSDLFHFIITIRNEALHCVTLRYTPIGVCNAM